MNYIFMTLVVCSLLGKAVASPLYDDETPEAADYYSNDGVQEVNKRDLEFNQYVPAYRLRGEPSCEELRTMWRLSKREARRATSTNNLPRARQYSFGRLMAFAPSHHSRQFVFGQPRNFAGGGVMSPVKGSFKQLMGILGSGAGRPGSYQRVRGLVASQRLPGETSKGKYNELRDMVLDYHLDKSNPKEVVQSSPALSSSDVYQPVRRTPPYKINQDTDRFGKYTDGITAKDWRLALWNYQNRVSCLEVQESVCSTNSDCECTGQYRCSSGRCKVLTLHSDLAGRLR